MEREHRKNYFIIGSVILEIVSPMYLRQLESYYLSKGFSCLTDFLQSKAVLHLLFHLRYKNTKCCSDLNNCVTNRTLPLNVYQWKLMYSDKSLQKTSNNCFCKYIANRIQLDDLHNTLSSFLLLHCCNLPSNVSDVIIRLREIKNEHLTHNCSGTINQSEYKKLLPEITKLILKIDPSLQDNLVRLERRPLDDTLCHKYSTDVSSIQTNLHEVYIV